MNRAGHKLTNPSLRERIAAIVLLTAGLPLVTAAFLLPAMPFWAAILPLAAGIALATPLARAAAMAAFLLPAALICAWGFIGIGIAPALVWPAALLVVAALAGMTALIGITAATALMTAVPVFPASPLLPFADALPPLGLYGLIAALGLAAALEYGRNLISAGGVAGLALLGMFSSLGAGTFNHWTTHGVPVWIEAPAPRTVTERTGWIAIRDNLNPGTTAVLGENVFAAGDTEALRFWCRAVKARELTLYIGVAEPMGAASRGAVWRLDAHSCERPVRPEVVYRARLGIPGVTGTWGPMPPIERTDPLMADVLICLEAFLPRAWVPLLQGSAATGQPVVILSNDTAFAPIPVHVLRRKAAGAMAGLAGRPVVHAETTRTVLLREDVR